MRKRSRIALALLLLAVVGGIVWLALRPREPMYKGKPLSFWFQNYDVTDKNSMEQLYDAVQNAGTNAIPLLLRRLQAKDSPLMLRLVALCRKQYIFQIKFTEAIELQDQGRFGFFLLGAKGKDAVPELIKILNERGSSDTACCVTLVLAYFGPEARQAVPSLLRGLEDTDAYEQSLSAMALGSIHADSQLVVPALVKCLTNNQGFIKLSAMNALSSFGADAKMAVPELIKLLNGSDQYMSDTAKDALKQIDPEAAAKAGVK